MLFCASVSGYEKGYLEHISLSLFLVNYEIEQNFSPQISMTKIGNFTKVTAYLSFFKGWELGDGDSLIF